MVRTLVLLFVLLALWQPVYAQQDTTGRRSVADSTAELLTNHKIDSVGAPPKQARADTGKKESYWGRPQKAALYSAILPGAGQVYNCEAWKVPIIYTGLGVLAYFWVSNGKEYNKWNNILKARADSTTPAQYYQGRYDTRQLIQIRDFYRRNRDFTIILTGLTYLLQIADAHVFAHLKGFNVTDDLALKPAVIPMQGASVGIWQPVSPGLSLTLHLK